MKASETKYLDSAMKPRSVKWKNKQSTATTEQTILATTLEGAAICALMVSNGGSVEHEVSIYVGTGNDSDVDKAWIIYVPPLGGNVFFNLIHCEREYYDSEGLYFKRLSSGTDEISVNVGYIDLTN